MRYLSLLLLLLPMTAEGAIKIKPTTRQALNQAAEAFNLSSRLLTALCFKESSLRPRVIHHHDGDGDSYGLCQIKLATAQDMGFTGSIEQLLNPYVNSYYAAKFIRHQLDRYSQDWVRAISAYNAGHAGEMIVNKQYIKDVFNLTLEVP